MNEELLAKCCCSFCSNHIEFPIEAAGSQVNCPHCGQPTELSLLSPPAPASDKPTAAELVAAFGGPMTRTPVSAFYRMGLVLVAAMMVLLPLVYVGLIAAVGYGVWWYATHFSFLLHYSKYGVRVWIAEFVAYVAPLFAGLVLVLFMVKPLFARRAGHAHPLNMNPAFEPALYAFIAKICDLVGAPMPQRISLNCDLNASAGFMRGAASLFGNDLRLTIGLPLMAGLNLGEFASVIAHEFGHFTQGFGMRLTYVIRSINFWFARLVFQRDALDVWLEEAGTEAENGWVVLVVTCARMAIGMSRLLLKLVMLLGHSVSCFMLRQMEYHADSYAVNLAGSATAEAATRRLAELLPAMEKAYKETRAMWNMNRRLPDDLPAFMVMQHSMMKPALRQRIQDRLGLARTRLFDTHPSDGDRIRQYRQAGEPGVFHSELPASVLFTRFDVVSNQVTQLHYREDLHILFDATNLRPVLPTPAS